MYETEYFASNPSIIVFISLDRGLPAGFQMDANFGDSVGIAESLLQKFKMT
jgi:hypothetical protein